MFYLLCLLVVCFVWVGLLIDVFSLIMCTELCFVVDSDIFVVVLICGLVVCCFVFLVCLLFKFVVVYVWLFWYFVASFVCLCCSCTWWLMLFYLIVLFAIGYGRRVGVVGGVCFCWCF